MDRSRMGSTPRTTGFAPKASAVSPASYTKAARRRLFLAHDLYHLTTYHSTIKDFLVDKLDKLLWMKLSYTLLPCFVQENPDDFYPALAVYQ